MTYEKACHKYPCDKRDKEPHACNCQPDVENAKTQNLFWCHMQARNVNLTLCRDCNYRENKFGPPNP